MRVNWATSAALILLLPMPPLAEAFVHRIGNLNADFLRSQGLKIEEQRKNSKMGHWSGIIKPGANAPEFFGVKEKTFEMPLDHFGSMNETYKNRYWVFEKFFVQGGPIFLMDGGEYNATDVAKLWLENSMLTQLLKDFGGLGIYWEHRYYGESIPPWAYGISNHTIDVGTPVERFKFLTMEQSLADMKYFADRFKSERYPELDVTPGGSPWVFIGGSYSGIRAAFIRQKYPETIFASYSSSAPVEAQIDFAGYYEQVYRVISKLNPACAQNIRAAIAYIDLELDKSEASATAIKGLFLGADGEKNGNTAFAELLTVQFQNIQNWSIDKGPDPDNNLSISNLCGWLNSDGEGRVSPPEGWVAAKAKANGWVAERWAQYPQWPFIILFYRDTQCGGFKATVKGRNDCNLETRMGKAEDISWAWQTCSEWGYFTTANIGPNQIVSKYLDTSWGIEECKSQFLDTTAAKYLPNLPAANQTNDLFGGWSRPQSRTFYTASGHDPWAVLSFLSNETYSPRNVFTKNIPACEPAQSSNELFGYMVKDGTHCEDIVSSSDSALEANKLFSQALRTWLPCYRKTNSKEVTKVEQGEHFQDL
ncbi:hypothetical protein ABW20_dc0105286 [Dactylellina cionopaga]|nr:hypothetical protein ABW20_dc0105286 [Dactylellina cionopaga]